MVVRIFSPRLDEGGVGAVVVMMGGVGRVGLGAGGKGGGEGWATRERVVVRISGEPWAMMWSCRLDCLQFRLDC